MQQLQTYFYLRNTVLLWDLQAAVCSQSAISPVVPWQHHQTTNPNETPFLLQQINHIPLSDRCRLRIIALSNQFSFPQRKPTINNQMKRKKQSQPQQKSACVFKEICQPVLHRTCILLLAKNKDGLLGSQMCWPVNLLALTYPRAEQRTISFILFEFIIGLKTFSNFTEKPVQSKCLFQGRKGERFDGDLLSPSFQK